MKRKKRERSIIAVSLNKNDANKQIGNIFVKYIDELTTKELKSMNNIVLYHRVWKSEGFEKTAHMLYELLKRVVCKFPSKKRHLHLDIEGHRNEQGGFDKDMYELMLYFIIGTLATYFSTIHIPLIGKSESKRQINDIPEESEMMKTMFEMMVEEKRKEIMNKSITMTLTLSQVNGLCMLRTICQTSEAERLRDLFIKSNIENFKPTKEFVTPATAEEIKEEMRDALSFIDDALSLLLKQGGNLEVSFLKEEDL